MVSTHLNRESEFIMLIGFPKILLLVLADRTRCRPLLWIKALPSFSWFSHIKWKCRNPQCCFTVSKRFKSTAMQILYTKLVWIPWNSVLPPEKCEQSRISENEKGRRFIVLSLTAQRPGTMSDLILSVCFPSWTVSRFPTLLFFSFKYEKRAVPNFSLEKSFILFQEKFC